MRDMYMFFYFLVSIVKYIQCFSRISYGTLSSISICTHARARERQKLFDQEWWKARRCFSRKNLKEEKEKARRDVSKNTIAHIVSIFSNQKKTSDYNRREKKECERERERGQSMNKLDSILLITRQDNQHSLTNE